jgi:LPXTG-motif cell wall-anchored protein
LNTLIKASVVAAIAFGGPIAVASAASANTCPAGQTVYLVNGAHDEWVCIPTPLNGKDGADGADGAKGATGATGPAGAPSTVQGPTGPVGPAGQNGKDGVSITGPTGATGPAGKDGADGRDGLDANCTTGSAAPAAGSGSGNAADVAKLVVAADIGGSTAVSCVGAQGPAGPAGADGHDGHDGKDSTVAGPVGAPGVSPVIESFDAKGDCPAGGVVIVGKASASAEGTLFTSVICNGINGKNGAAGKADQTTIVTKDANGNVISSQTVAGLPSTGGNGNLDWAIGGIALLAILGGGTAVYVTSRRKSA